MILARPFRCATFRRLAAGRLVSHAGDWLLLVALVSWIYGQRGSTGSVALVLILRLLPPVLGGGLAAAIVDRFHRGRLLVWIEGARAAVSAGALAGVVLDIAPLVLAGVAAFGALAAISSVTVRSLVPSIVPERELAAANAGVGISEEAAMAIGALAGGVVMLTLGAAGALGVVLASAVVAAMLFCALRRLEAPAATSAGRNGLVAGLEYLAASPALVVVVGAFAAAAVATGLTNATLPRFLDDVGLGSEAYGFGLAALAGGLALGEALAGFVPVERVTPQWIAWSLGAMALALAAAAHASTAALALVLLALVGVADGTSEVVFATVVQRECDSRYLGRVFGLASTCMTTTSIGAVAAAPLLNAIASPSVSLTVAAGCLLVAAGGTRFVGGRALPVPAAAQGRA